MGRRGGGGRGQQEVRGRGAKGGDDAGVGGGAGGEGLAGEEVGVDDGEVVGGTLEEGGDGGFAGGEGAGEADEDHGCVVCGDGGVRVDGGGLAGKWRGEVWGLGESCYATEMDVWCRVVGCR